MKAKEPFPIIYETILVLCLCLFLLLSQSCSKQPVEPEPELQLQEDPEPDPEPEPESPGKILYAAKIYGTRLTSEDASWIASHCDLLITDGSSDDWTFEMKATNPDLRLFRYITTRLVKEPTEIFITNIPISDLLEEHDNWFWRTEGGDYVHPVEDPGAYLIDPAASTDGWSNYWATEALNLIDGLLYEGVHGDLAAIDVASLRENCPDIDNRYPTEADFHAAQEPCLSSFRALLNGHDKLLLLNNVTCGSSIDPDYLTNTRIFSEDGFNWQAYAMKAKSSPEDPFVGTRGQEFRMDVIDIYSGVGKTLVLGAQPRVNREDILYCIGCYLLVKQDPNVYLNIDWDGNYNNMQMLFNDFGPLFETDYGQPLGPRYEENGVWVREFSRGTVAVNLQTHTFEFRDNGN
jgi:hypothetical protein